MCAAFESKKIVRRPGKPVGIWSGPDQSQTLIWAGFARQESLGWWKKKGGLLVDLPAERYAERSERDGQLTWDDVPGGHVIRGLLDPNEGKPLLNVITRASNQAELEKFEHPRMPVIEAPLHSADLIEIPEPVKPLSAQRELF